MNEINKLEKAIRNTYELWKEDKMNRDFYDNYIFLLLDEVELIEAECYFKYWESLKKYDK